MMENIEITLQELRKWRPDEYRLVDVRDEMSFSYGHLPGAEHVPEQQISDGWVPPEDGRKTVLYCKKGETSLEAAGFLQEKGHMVYSLKGGYLAWLMGTMEEENEKDEKEETPFYLEVEQSIRKRFKKKIWCRFTKAINDYELVKEGDKIAVCISGGKDSMLMAKLMQELQRHSDVPFELVFLVMDPGYNEINRQKIESNAELLHIPVTIFESNIFSVANNTEKNPCYLCARMRRGHLYSKAKELGCNKIALGHHFNDVIETTVMSMFYGSQLQAMPPKLHSTSFPGMTLIRPMYCIREEDILAWKRYNDLEFIQCACRFTENCTMCDNGGGGSKRQEIKILLRRLKRDNPNIENSIFRSIHNVAIDTMPGYRSEGVDHSFLERFNAMENH